MKASHIIFHFSLSLISYQFSYCQNETMKWISTEEEKAFIERQKIIQNVL